MAKRWKKEDDSYLKRYAKTRRLEDLSKRFKTDVETITAKLEGMGLQAKDSTMVIKVQNDPVVQVFERGMKALYQEDWKGAKAIFEQVIEDSDFPVLAQRAGQYLELCAQNLSKPAKGGGDPFLEAVLEHNAGNFEQALELCTRSGRQASDHRFAYLAGAIHSMSGNGEKAAEALAAAIEMEPKNRLQANFDPDFENLRSDRAYASLFDTV